MSDRHYEIERTMTKPSAGGTVTPTTGESSRQSHKLYDDDDDNDDDVGKRRISASRTESKSVQRKRRRTPEPTSARTGIPRKSPRWTGEKQLAEHPPDERASEDVSAEDIQPHVHNDESTIISSTLFSTSFDNQASQNIQDSAVTENINISHEKEQISTDRNFHETKNNCVVEPEPEVEMLSNEKKINDNLDDKCNYCDVENIEEEKKMSSNRNFSEMKNNCGGETEPEVEMLSRKPPIHPDVPRRRVMGLATTNRRDDSTRLRKTIQWLEDGARKLREDLAEARAELHEERRASRIARREIEVAVREARANETAKHQRLIAELKTRLSQSPSRSTTEGSSASTKAEFLKDENHRREISALKKRLAEADATIRKLRSNSLDSVNDTVASGKRRKLDNYTSNSELRKLDGQVKSLRAANKKLEDKLNMVCIEAGKIRTMELRIQHENHETELNALKKSLRSDAIRMMDEIKNKDREIERLGRLVRENRKSRTKDDDTMRKLRENENGHQVRLAARIEDKIPHQVENEIDLFKNEFEEGSEVERLRELAVEQQEFIEVLRQAVKEKDRKLDQLEKKKRKEEFYRQWIELEPVAEVDDEEEHEEGDSALSSAPSSLSPQPGGCGSFQTNGVTREAYEAVLLEIDEIQTKFLEEQQELAHAKSQVRELEKALLQETRGSQNSKRALSEKLRKFEEREAALLAEISELRDQNELLEFRVLELEESPTSRETPDTADSGIVSPEPINIFKQEQNNKQRDRAIATVLPFSSYTHPASPVAVKKAPLSLQESGIFEADDDEMEEEMEEEEVPEDREIELTSCGTQTEAPVGELLQEVQRLQELRERIQERAAVKVPSTNPSPSESSIESKTEEDKSLYREKIRQLEEKLAEREEEEAKRMENHLVVKQREEDLLDENYRLTERVYWLENELRNTEEEEEEEEEKTLIDVETMTEEKTSSIDEETMTEIHENFVDAETMTEEKNEKTTSHVDTMTQVSFPSENISEEIPKIEENDKTTFAEISKISRCEKIYQKALQDNFVAEGASKISTMEIDGFTVQQKLRDSSKNNDNIDECSECLSLRKDYDEKIDKLTKAECRYRGRVVDFERKEEAFHHTLKQVDVTWSKLENDHAKKLEEIGRRLEEKVKCNRRIIERVAELEMIENREVNNKTCSCKCGENNFTSGGISFGISSADDKQNQEIRGIDSRGIDEADTAMDVDIEDIDQQSKNAIKLKTEVEKNTQTEDFECSNCEKKRERNSEKKAISLRRFSTKNVVEIPTVDVSTEIGIEAKEEMGEKSTSSGEVESGGVSRVHLLAEEERPAAEPTENRRVTINERELDKKVREENNEEFDERVGREGEGWLVTKSWNIENFRRVKGENNDRVHESDFKSCTIFRHGGLHYVIYPEICV